MRSQTWCSGLNRVWQACLFSIHLLLSYPGTSTITVRSRLMIKEQNEQNGRLKAQNREQWCLSSLRAPNWQEILSHSGISVCGGTCLLKFAVHFLDSDCPASVTFYTCYRPPKGTDPVVCTLDSSEILLQTIWTVESHRNAAQISAFLWCLL